MSQWARDVLLVALSAVMTSFTFHMRDWTGMRSSLLWPIGASVLLMIVFLVIDRKQEIRITLLLASLIGILSGLFLATCVHRAQLGRIPFPSPISAIGLAGCTWLYFKGERQQREIDEEMARFDRDLESIRSLPENQRGAALIAHIEGLKREIEAYDRDAQRLFPIVNVLIGAGMLLTAATIPHAFSPEPNPVMIAVDLSLLLLGCVWFTMQAPGKIREKKDQVPPGR